MANYPEQPAGFVKDEDPSALTILNEVANKCQWSIVWDVSSAECTATVRLEGPGLPEPVSATVQSTRTQRAKTAAAQTVLMHPSVIMGIKSCNRIQQVLKGKRKREHESGDYKGLLLNIMRKAANAASQLPGFQKGMFVPRFELRSVATQSGKNSYTCTLKIDMIANTLVSVGVAFKKKHAEQAASQAILSEPEVVSLQNVLSGIRKKEPGLLAFYRRAFPEAGGLEGLTQYDPPAIQAGDADMHSHSEAGAGDGSTGGQGENDEATTIKEIEAGPSNAGPSSAVKPAETDIEGNEGLDSEQRVESYVMRIPNPAAVSSGTTSEPAAGTTGKLSPSPTPMQTTGATSHIAAALAMPQTATAAKQPESRPPVIELVSASKQAPPQDPAVKYMMEQMARREEPVTPTQTATPPQPAKAAAPMVSPEQQIPQPAPQAVAAPVQQQQQQASQPAQPMRPSGTANMGPVGVFTTPTQQQQQPLTQTAQPMRPSGTANMGPVGVIQAATAPANVSPVTLPRPVPPAAPPAAPTAQQVTTQNGTPMAIPADKPNLAGFAQFLSSVTNPATGAPLGDAAIMFRMLQEMMSSQTASQLVPEGAAAFAAMANQAAPQPAVMQPAVTAPPQSFPATAPAMFGQAGSGQSTGGNRPQTQTPPNSNNKPGRGILAQSLYAELSRTNA